MPYLPIFSNERLHRTLIRGWFGRLFRRLPSLVCLLRARVLVRCPWRWLKDLRFLFFLASLRNGFSHIDKIDHFYLGAVLLGLIPWLLTKDPTLSVVVAVSIDIIAFIPTIRKTRRRPKSEQPSLFVANVLRHILVLAA